MRTQSLSTAIYRHKADWFTYLALTGEAEERGETTKHIAHGYKTSADVLASWDRPAESLSEAIEALKVAVDDYEAGDTPRIPAMMKAALGWLDAEYKRRTSL